MMDFETWQQRILESLTQLSSRAYQLRSWFGDGPEVSSPDEMLCDLYDDCDFESFCVVYRHTLGPRVPELATELSDAVEELGEHLEPRQMIQDHRWDRIRSLAHSLHMCINGCSQQS